LKDFSARKPASPSPQQQQQQQQAAAAPAASSSKQQDTGKKSTIPDLLALFAKKPAAPQPQAGPSEPASAAPLEAGAIPSTSQTSELLKIIGELSKKSSQDTKPTPVPSAQQGAPSTFYYRLFCFNWSYSPIRYCTL